MQANKTQTKKITGNEAFQVPNTRQGKLFIELARKFIHKGKFCMRVRGRGSRKEYAKVVGGYTARTGLSLAYAEKFAVYVNRSYKKN